MNNSAPDILKFPIGQLHPLATPTPSQSLLPSAESVVDIENEDLESAPQSSTEKVPTVHIEKAGFTGDRVLANSILFKLEYSWWIEASYAIPEGDIGRVWEIMKVRSSHMMSS